MPNKDPELERKYQLEYHRNYRVSHRAQLAKHKRKYVESHRGRCAATAYSKRYLEENRELMAEKRRNRHAENPEIRRAYQRKWYARHPEIRDIKRAQHRLDPQKERARKREYHKKNPHVAIKITAMRRMRIEATVEGESAIADFIKLVRNSRRIACYYCGKMVSGKKAHIDHMIPLSKGGSHRPDNLCASCPPCNQSKHAKVLGEWKPPGAQQLMPI